MLYKYFICILRKKNYIEIIQTIIPYNIYNFFIRILKLLKENERACLKKQYL